MSWETFFKQEQALPYYQELMHFLQDEYNHKTIYPKQEDLFACFKPCPYEDLKVVIIGQDPYHQPNQAHGLAFSVNKGIKLPPSLKNIYKELENDLGIEPCNHGYLLKWAQQGVFLMNTIMSVEEGKPLSHQNKGWEQFTNHLISYLNERDKGLVFILWGKNAIDKQKLITNPQHKIISGPHPSPLSAYRGFFGSKPFSQCNEYLKQLNQDEIDWNLDDSLRLF